ncbi:hypothetical protein HNW13_017465 [Shewanella sp. BF02_Schw]|uniref:hypothetical protein n=1 Tax=Shewanella sp. BF02_Schw TaxID=394908 RepID=UPI00177CCE50|nr:hypothetical protein [Shewanella sp. BF02_Schw]MBO1897528.1 hypothetical protein [Shewanella sp. BF02_Schw]
MTKKYITAVFEYEEGEEFPAQIAAAFAKNEAFHGVKITAVSLEDEITRVEQLEEQLA